MSKQFFEWTDDLSVGIQEIDEQHKVLVGLANRLYDQAILHQAEDSVVQGILNELVEYTIVHFAVEESLFRIFHYPDMDAHIAHHQGLRQQALEIQKRIQLGQDKVNTELLVFLRKWLQNHIQQEDKRYSAFFLQQGVKANWKEKETHHSWFGKLFGGHH